MNDNSKWQKLLNWIIVVLVGVNAGLFIHASFEIQPVRVHGQSMFPAIFHNDRLMVYNKVFFTDATIERGDIVVIAHGEKLLCKRVIAVPGDRLVIKSGLVFVNGKMQTWEHLLDSHTAGKVDLRLGSTEYWIMGDNRKISHDSRSFGVIDREQIQGKALLRWRAPTGL